MTSTNSLKPVHYSFHFSFSISNSRFLYQLLSFPNQIASSLISFSFPRRSLVSVISRLSSQSNRCARLQKFQSSRQFSTSSLRLSQKPASDEQQSCFSIIPRGTQQYCNFRVHRRSKMMRVKYHELLLNQYCYCLHVLASSHVPQESYEPSVTNHNDCIIY